MHRVRVVLILTLLSVGYTFVDCGAASAQSNLPPVDSDLKVTFSGYVLDHASNTFDTTVTLTNVSAQALSGSLSFVVQTITPSSVTLENPTCQPLGTEGVIVSALPAAGLAPGETLSPFVLKFGDPSMVAWTYTHTILAGDLCSSAVTFHALEDSRILPDDNTILQSLEQFAPNYCQAFVRPNPLTLNQAITSMQQRLDEIAGPGAIESVLAANAQTNQEVLNAEAMAATADQKGAAALAALLAAHQNDPMNPLHLVNAAGAANLLLMPNEALALLDAADALSANLGSPMGISGNGVALNNRGFALLQMGQWSQAETAFNSAIALEPYLSEARRNLGIALLCQGNASAGEQAFRAGLRRSPTQLPIDQIFDLSQGLGANLPPIDYPALPGLLPSYRQYWAQLSGSITSQSNNDNSQIAALQPQLNQAEADEASSFKIAALSRQDDIEQYEGELALDLGATFGSYTPKIAPLIPLAAAVESARTAENNFLTSASQQVQALIQKAQMAPTAAQANAFKAQCRSLIRQTHTQWLYDQGKFESAVRSFTNVWYRDATGLAENVSLSPLNQVLSLQANFSLLSEYQDILNGAQGYDALFEDPWFECQGTESEASPDVEPPSLGASPGCPDSLKAAKLNLSLFEAFSIGLSCEKLTLKLAEPGLGPFISISGTRSGEWTIFAGAKGSLPGVPLSESLGFYVRGNDQAITAGGIKSSPSASIGPVSYDLPFGYEWNVADAVQCPFGFCQ